jgi:hypothetical protein
MDTFAKAGKKTEEVFEKTIIFTEEIAAKAVDVIDALEEMVMDLPHKAKIYRSRKQPADGPGPQKPPIRKNE